MTFWSYWNKYLIGRTPTEMNGTRLKHLATINKARNSSLPKFMFTLFKNINFHLLLKLTVIIKANRHFLFHESTGVRHKVISRSNTVSSLVSFLYFWFILFCFFTSTDVLGKKIDNRKSLSPKCS